MNLMTGSLEPCTGHTDILLHVLDVLDSLQIAALGTVHPAVDTLHEHILEVLVGLQIAASGILHVLDVPGWLQIATLGTLHVLDVLDLM